MENQHSKYYHLDAEQSYKRFTGLNLCTAIIVLIVGLLIIWWMLYADQVILSYLALAVTAFVVHNLKILMWNQLQGILLIDCDPVKLLQVYEIMEQKRPYLGTKSGFLRLKAECCMYRKERWEQGFACLEKVNFKKKNIVMELLRTRLYFSYYALLEQWDELYRLQREMEELTGRYKLKGRAEKYYQMTMLDCKYKVLLHEEKYEEANAMTERRMQESGKLPLNQVILIMRIAQEEARRGEKEKALEHLKFVIDNGNTLSTVDEAKELFEKIG